MDRIWLDAPAPALCLRHDAGTLRLRANAAAERWAGRAGLCAETLLQLDCAPLWALRGQLDSQSGDAPATPVLQIGERSVPCTALALPGPALLLWLQPPEDSPERTAQAQRASEFLDRALVLAGVSVWRIDLATRRIHFNAVGFQANGLEQDPAGVDLAMMDSAVHPDDAAAVRAATREALNSERVVDTVTRWHNTAGVLRTLLMRRVAERDAAGRAVGVWGVSLDLSRHLAERERNQALAEQARLVVDALGVGFWSHDLDSGVMVWDAQMCRMHGRDPAAGALQHEEWLQACVHADDRERLRERTRRANEGADPLLETVFRAHDRDGQPRWVQAWASRDMRGGRRMVFGMNLDITERKRAEYLHQEQQRLQRESRDKSAFMARMSHELRTPMNAVLGFTGYEESDHEQPPTERQRERLALIGNAGRELMGLIDGLLAIADRDLAPLPETPQAALHVLCVEDNPVNLQLVQELLALRPQVRLRTAVDGLSGVRAALDEPPDLLLLDLQLPDIDGTEVMRRVRAAPAGAGCRIVALSADAMPDHITAALAAGFDDYWTKPIQFDNFLAHIDRLAASLQAGGTGGADQADRAG